MRGPELTYTDGRRAVLIWGGAHFLRVVWVFVPQTSPPRNVSQGTEICSGISKGQTVKLGVHWEEREIESLLLLRLDLVPA